MYTTKFVALAFIGSAAAFNPVMQMSTGRRAAIQGAGAAAIAAPLLRSSPASAAMKKDNNAPIVTVFDARKGCTAKADQYTGAKANSDDDKMCVKVQMSKVVAGNADAVLAGVLGQL
jgi:hypothetical protein